METTAGSRGAELCSSPCNLCPRNCQALREKGQTGYCGVGEQIRVARAALHMWEEPCISGKSGSGAVFFCGCNLRCIYCQNYEIAGGMRGTVISEQRLAEIFLELQEKGAANINLVTPDHYLTSIIKAADTESVKQIFHTTPQNPRQIYKRLRFCLSDILLPLFIQLHHAQRCA